MVRMNKAATGFIRVAYHDMQSTGESPDTTESAKRMLQAAERLVKPETSGAWHSARQEAEFSALGRRRYDHLRYRQERAFSIRRCGDIPLP